MNEKKAVTLHGINKLAITIIGQHMFCEDIDSALASLSGRYEEVAYVCDEGAKGDKGEEKDSCLWLRGGEGEKGIETVERIWDYLFERGITRRGLLVAIGGGVVTDMAGFAAATYKRGIDWVAVPTTLLAMVDASTGGKTGFNYHGLKNSIGAFYPPVETIIWPGWLKTLPARELLSGFGEMVKTGAIVESQKTASLKAERLWEALMGYDLERMDIEELTPLIKACVAAKERIVAADPKEEGLRKVLNFGHTFGHALEEAPLGPPPEGGKKERIPHGYAVLYGMIAELYLSVVKLGCPREPLQQLTQMVIHYYGKPECKCSDRGKLIELMQQDKKNEHAGEINCTLIRGIGEPVINQVITEAEAEEAWEYLFSL